MDDQHGRRGGEPTHILFQAGDFFAGADLEAAFDSGAVIELLAGTDLAVDFGVAIVVDGDEGGGGELFAGGGDGVEPVGLAEGAKEFVVFVAGLTKTAPFAKDDGPGEAAGGDQ